jgi:septation ring formation regulator EzrA
MPEVHERVAETNGLAQTFVDQEVARIQAQLDGQEGRAQALRAELRELDELTKRYEKAIRDLRGDYPRMGRKPSKPATSSGEKVRPVQSKVGPEAMAKIEEAIRAYAEDHEEFRQVDIRATLTGALAHSSKMAVAFEQLRQANVIRLARQEGIQKFFRLTRETLNEK